MTRSKSVKPLSKAEVADRIREHARLAALGECGHTKCAAVKEAKRARGLARAANAEARRAAAAAKKAEMAALRAARLEMEESRRAYHELRRTTGRIRKHRKHHGLDEAAWFAMLESVGWACELCGTGLTEETGNVDHSHSRAEAMCSHNPNHGCPVCIRGVLCNRCNSVLGVMGDDPSMFDKAVAYLERTE